MTIKRRRGQRAVRVPLTPLLAGEIRLPDHLAEYVCDVLRLAVGDRITLFDPESKIEADAELIGFDHSMPIVRVAEPRPAKVLPPRRVTLIQGMVKGDKMDAIIRDATELGATRVVPAVMERSVSRPAAEDARAERWRRIAVDAARQCGRGDAPEIAPPTPFDKAIRWFVTPEEVATATAFCLDPNATVPLRARLLPISPRATVVFVVGPEGGFSESELMLCQSHNVHRVSMGPLILRTETVCAAALGALLVLGAEDEEA